MMVAFFFEAKQEGFEPLLRDFIAKKKEQWFDTKDHETKKKGLQRLRYG